MHINYRILSFSIVYNPNDYTFSWILISVGLNKIDFWLMDFHNFCLAFCNRMNEWIRIHWITALIA